MDLPSLQVDFARLRGVFIAKNLESMQYDLAVLDEFQNYTQILSLSGQADTEADQIVQRLLGGDTRVLLLSATPFACSGAVLEQIWDMDEGEDGDSGPALTRPEQFGEEFDRLMRFMGEGQETGLQTPADAGIFRTTRGAAAAHPPIIEGHTGVIQPDFFYALRVNQVGSGRCQARYSWSTPYALTFSYGYRFNRDCGEEDAGLELVHQALAGEEGLSGVPLTERALVELFEGIFCSRSAGGCGPQAVRRFYAVPSYAGAVRQYCQDGCFEDMIREYAALLAGEFGERDEEMAKAVEWAAAYRQPKARLTLWDEARDGPRWYELAPSSPFAAGLYATNREGTNGERRLAEIKNAFNAPIQPFVFATTSIGTEGIDLHWYARNIVHWSVPSRPADLEQREGRVLRYQCHAVRLNEALIREGRVRASERDCVREAYLGSGMYPAQLSFFSDEERSAQSPEGCWHVRRYRYFTPFSWEEASYAEAEKAIQSYQELLRRLQTAPSGRG